MNSSARRDAPLSKGTTIPGTQNTFMKCLSVMLRRYFKRLSQRRQGETICFHLAWMSASKMKVKVATTEIVIALRRGALDKKNKKKWKKFIFFYSPRSTDLLDRDYRSPSARRPLYLITRSCPLSESCWCSNRISAGRNWTEPHPNEAKWTETKSSEAMLNPPEFFSRLRVDQETE